MHCNIWHEFWYISLFTELSLTGSWIFLLDSKAAQHRDLAIVTCRRHDWVGQQIKEPGLLNLWDELLKASIDGSSLSWLSRGRPRIDPSMTRLIVYWSTSVQADCQIFCMQLLPAATAEIIVLCWQPSTFEGIKWFSERKSQHLLFALTTSLFWNFSYTLNNHHLFFFFNR